MKRFKFLLIGVTAVVVLSPVVLYAEILAMMNYESKAEQTIRREGIAVVDMDPESANFGKVLMDMPLPPDLVAHHIFYNHATTKAYVTALGKRVLYVIDMTKNPYRIKIVDVPDCGVGEDVTFSKDDKIFYQTCLGSNAVIVGDAVADKPIKTISTPKPYPHGIAFNEGIDRILITSTVRDSDLGDAGETITVIEASTGKILSIHKVSNKPSPSSEAPVEVTFVPGSNPPMVFVTNMYGNTLWVGTWVSSKKDFEFKQAFDFGPTGSSVPLEMYFNEKGDRLYVTTAKPGHFHIFDISEDPDKPVLLKTLSTAGGSHHVSFSPDEKYAFVQNSLLNLKGMSDGSVTVIDLVKEEVVASMDTLKNQGLNPNCIVLLPEWYHDAGH
jgi:DNA-binding beta-propeller fold protein YncE